MVIAMAAKVLRVRTQSVFLPYPCVPPPSLVTDLPVSTKRSDQWEGGLQVREKEWGCILLRVPNPVLGGLERGLWSSTTLVKNLCALVSSSVKWGQEEQSSPHRIWGQLNEFTQVQVLYKG